MTRTDASARRNARRQAQRCMWRKQVAEFEKILGFARLRNLSPETIRQVRISLCDLRKKLGRNVNRPVPQLDDSSEVSNAEEGSSQHESESESVQPPNLVLLVS
jgi:hypothetical protein